MKYFDQLWYDCALDKVRQLMEGRNKFVVFDVGAGDCVLEKPIGAMGGEWVGFDRHPRKSNVLTLDLDAPPPSHVPDKTPDVILHLEVIEHVFNANSAAANLSSLARSGTFLILTTPNPFWSLNRLKFLFLNQFPNFEPLDTEQHHHVFTYWPHVLKKLLTNHGFKVVDEFTLGAAVKFPSLSAMIRNPFRVPLYFVRKLMEATTPVCKGMSYGVVAVKL